MTVGSDEAIAMAKRLAREEGIFCGISSGSQRRRGNAKVARHHPKMKRIVTMICDTGQRYFSTELCGAAKHVESPSASILSTATPESSWTSIRTNGKSSCEMQA